MNCFLGTKTKLYHQDECQPQDLALFDFSELNYQQDECTRRCKETSTGIREIKQSDIVHHMAKSLWTPDDHNHLWSFPKLIPQS